MKEAPMTFAQYSVLTGIFLVGLVCLLIYMAVGVPIPDDLRAMIGTCGVTGAMCPVPFVLRRLYELEGEVSRLKGRESE
jgi:hypothetical protein